MKPLYLIAGILALFVFGALLTVTFSQDMKEASSSADTSYPEVPFIEIVEPAGFVNTEGITIGELIGTKVVLVEFLTYSCINCQRTFPYITRWYSKYKDEGLEIIGIHTPEFAFERDITNVRNAMREYGIEYPIVLDNDYKTWGAYGNKYWPRKYLIDIHGNIVYDHIGEGAYEETEAKIQELLRERAEVLGVEVGSDTTRATAVSVPAKSSEAASPETYFGYARNELLTNGIPFEGGPVTLAIPDTIRLNRLYLGGSWVIEPQSARAVKDAVVRYTYRAREVYIVASSDSNGTIEVRQDGEVVGNTAGADVQNGTVQVGNATLYKLINNGAQEEHELELRVSPDVRIYTFTFG